MVRSNPIYVPILVPGLLLGLLLGPYASQPWWCLLLSAALAAVVAFIAPDRLVPLLFCSGFLFLGAARSHQNSDSWQVDASTGPVLAELCLEASALVHGRQVLAARLHSLRSVNSSAGLGQPLWYGNRALEVSGWWGLRGRFVGDLGECWLVRGVLLAARSKLQPLRLQVSGARLRVGGNTALVRSQMNWLVDVLRRFRTDVRQAIDRYAPPNLHGLFLAQVLGDRRHLDEELKESFVRTGTAHLLAISGLHVGIFALCSAAAARWLLSLALLHLRRALLAEGYVRQLSQCLGLSAATFYVLTAGAPISARRALVMLMSVGICQLVKRSGRSGHALALAAAGLSWWEPRVLHEIGFQLSVLSVASLLLWSGLQHRLRTDFPAWLSSALAAFGVSAVASIATAPLCLWSFGRTSLAGLWVNPIAVPLLGGMSLPLLLGGCALAVFFPQPGGLLIRAAGIPAGLGLAFVEAASEPSRCPQWFKALSGIEVFGLYILVAMVLIALVRGMR